ncbi:inverse autotransporter beta domain-containing protein [Roseibacillus ishigakijimensis]|uniref:Inverse autotransporter beta domain-containing protein n=1 Tax=Roseibacillus ishigakijimensis TaxID=454146 RepID=A0A934VLY3_9BACT|nr:inverse autotransporter beta domain-containing protein [Roseibacillus ishigakijimensis]
MEFYGDSCSSGYRRAGVGGELHDDERSFSPRYYQCLGKWSDSHNFGKRRCLHIHYRSSRSA